MSQVTIHIHPETAGPLLAAGEDGARRLAAALRRAVGVYQGHGREVAYAPILLGDGTGCAMSVRGTRSGIVVELDAPGTLLPGRGVVRDVRPTRPPRR